MRTRNLAAEPRTNNPLAVGDRNALLALRTCTAVTASVDLIGFYSNRPLWRGAKRQLAELLGVPVSTVYIGTNRQNPFGREIRIRRLSRSQLAALEAWMKVPKGIYWSWLDIAFDLEFSSEAQADVAHEYLKVHLVIPRSARGAEPLTCDTSRYAVNFHSPGRGKSHGKRPARSFIVYWKGPTTLRVELRFFGSSCIKRLFKPKRYFKPLSGIMDIDPEAILHRHLRLQVPSEAFFRKQVKLGKATYLRSAILAPGRRRKPFHPVNYAGAMNGLVKHVLYYDPQSVRDVCTLRPLELGPPIKWVGG